MSANRSADPEVAVVAVSEAVLVDSGASQHMVGLTNCSSDDLANATPVDVTLVTAMGLEKATKEVPFPTPALGIEAPALVLKHSP